MEGVVLILSARTRWSLGAPLWERGSCDDRGEWASPRHWPLPHPRLPFPEGKGRSPYAPNAPLIGSSRSFAERASTACPSSWGTQPDRSPRVGPLCHPSPPSPPRSICSRPAAAWRGASETASLWSGSMPLSSEAIRCHQVSVEPILIKALPGLDAKAWTTSGRELSS
jgi:hypothetical protein